jgi:hypothetical protein
VLVSVQLPEHDESPAWQLVVHANRRVGSPVVGVQNGFGSAQCVKQEPHVAGTDRTVSQPGTPEQCVRSGRHESGNTHWPLLHLAVSGAVPGSAAQSTSHWPQ